ncbi:MAG: type II secretion system protein [Verrucomicrobiota bacterium]
MSSKRRNGFTLIEIMIVVVMIGLLAAMSMPAFQRVRHNSQNANFANDVRIFSGLIETYITEIGTYPENSAPGVIPTGFESYVKTEQWYGAPSIGGDWDFERDTSGIKIAVGAHGFHATDKQLQKLDSEYDDGGLSTGEFRKLASGGYYFIISE